MSGRPQSGSAGMSKCSVSPVSILNRQYMLNDIEFSFPLTRYVPSFTNKLWRTYQIAKSCIRLVIFQFSSLNQ